MGFGQEPVKAENSKRQASTFGQPVAGRFASKDRLIASRQLPPSFSRSTFGHTGLKAQNGFLFGVEFFLGQHAGFFEPCQFYQLLFKVLRFVLRRGCQSGR
jgi:hypothetical protein